MICVLAPETRIFASLKDIGILRGGFTVQ